MEEKNLSYEELKDIANYYLEELFNNITFPMGTIGTFIRKDEMFTTDGKWKANYTYTSYEVTLTEDGLLRVLEAFYNYDWENGVGGKVTPAIYHYAECCKYFKESVDKLIEYYRN